MDTHIIFRSVRGLSGSRLNLGIRVILHCVAACAIIWKCTHAATLPPSTAVDFGFGAFVIVFVAFLPAMYLYAIYRTAPPES